MFSPINLRYIAANRNRYKDLTGQPSRPLDLVVLHCMEAPETEKTAVNVATWFATEPTPQTSAHACVDDGTVVSCVQLRDVAYAAPNANRNGIHVELAGYAKQTKADWLDAYGRSMLPLAACYLREIVLPKVEVLHPGRPIPVRYVDAAGLARGERGITTHWEVSKWSAAHGLPGDHTHTDPGPGFPIHEFIAMVGGS